LALLSPDETPDVIADVDAGAVTGIKSLWDNFVAIKMERVISREKRKVMQHETR